MFMGLKVYRVHITTVPTLHLKQIDLHKLREISWKYRQLERLQSRLLKTRIFALIQWHEFELRLQRAATIQPRDWQPLWMDCWINWANSGQAAVSSQVTVSNQAEVEEQSRLGVLAGELDARQLFKIRLAIQDSLGSRISNYLYS
jgi:hypothetical protein